MMRSEICIPLLLIAYWGSESHGFGFNYAEFNLYSELNLEKKKIVAETLDPNFIT